MNGPASANGNSAWTKLRGLRPATAADEPFLRDLFVSSRPDIAAVAALGEQGAALVDLQWRARQQQYDVAWPGHRDWIVEGPDGPAGRCWLHLGEALSLLDLAVAPEQRGRGIGRAVLASVMAFVEELGVPLRLHVWDRNDGAIGLYRGAGLRVIESVGGYLSMEWVPPEAGRDDA